MTFTFAPGLFRIVLALLVCVSHLTRLEVGQTAVFIFFMLSGYWSVRMYHEKYLRLPNPRVTFWIARFLRIWILYVICQIGAVLVFWVVLGSYSVSYWLGTPLLGLASHGRDILGVSWSLDLEVQFYLLVPLCAVWIAGWAKGAKVLLLGVLAAGLTILGWILIAQFGLVLIPAFVLPFLAGALIYERDWQVTSKGAIASLVAFFALAVAVIVYPGTYGLLDKTAQAPFDPRWFGLGWALLLVPFVAFNVRQTSTRFDRHIGNLSYSIYLVHFPFYKLMTTLLDGPSMLEKAAMLLATIPLALIPYLLIDQVIERHREAWSRRVADRLAG
ncbi:MAG: acyltransferase family protein [Sedimentitalea sp.]